MPFTPAHIAAVLPLRKIFKSKGTFSALVIGSMVPDMEYFLRFNSASVFSHTLKGVFLFDLPLALLIYYLWNLFLKQTVVTYVPGVKMQFKHKGDEFNMLSFPVMISAFIGILTHLLWDGFTHGKGFFVQQIDLLSMKVLTGVFSMKLCYALWYLSSIAGSVIVFRYFFMPCQNSSQNIHRSEKYDFWGKTLFLTLMLSVIRIAAGLSHNVPRHLVIIVIGAFIYSFCLMALTIYIKQKNYFKNY